MKIPSFNDIFDEMERYGYEMKRVSYEEWCSALKYMDPSKLEKNALFPLLYFVLNGLMIKMQSPPLNDDNTREAIADSDVPDNNIRGLPMQCQFTTEPPMDTTDNSAKGTETPPERTDNSKKKGI